MAAFTGNSNQDRRLKPELIANLKAQDPDLLFFSGDQVHDHTEHLGAWLLFGRQFGEIIRDRPIISIPDDHDVGQWNLWGAGGKAASTAAGDDGGYFMPVEYVLAMERRRGPLAYTRPSGSHADQRRLGVYYTTLNWGEVHECLTPSSPPSASRSSNKSEPQSARSPSPHARDWPHHAER